MDPVSRAATLEFVGGSHLGPWQMPRSFMTAEANWFPEGSLADLPDLVLMPPPQHALSGLARTRCPARRRVYSVHMTGEDVTHAPRRWVTSPSFPGLEAELPAGAPLEHRLFPMLWTASQTTAPVAESARGAQ